MFPSLVLLSLLSTIPTMPTTSTHLTYELTQSFAHYELGDREFVPVREQRELFPAMGVFGRGVPKARIFTAP